MKYSIALFLLLFVLLIGCTNKNEDRGTSSGSILVDIDSLNQLSTDSLIEKHGAKLPEWNKLFTASINDTYKDELVGIVGRIDDMEKIEETYMLEVLSSKPQVLAYMSVPENKMPGLIQNISSSKIKHRGFFVFRFTGVSKLRDRYEGYKILRGELVDYFIFRRPDTD